MEIKKDSGAVSLKKELKSSKFILGAGWDSKTDLDLSLIPKFSNGNLDASLITYFGNLQTVYAKHSGDNRTGTGAGDDEVIAVDLTKVPAGIDVIFASVYCYQKGNFGGVDGEFFKLYDEQGNVKIEVKMDEVQASNSATHLTAVKFTRAGDDWNVEFVGRYDTIPNEDLGHAATLVQSI